MTESASPSEVSALLRQRDYILFLCARFSASIAVQVQAVNIGWQVYTLAREGRTVKEAAFILSMIGLVQFLPVLFLTLPAGSRFRCSLSCRLLRCKALRRSISP